MAANFVLLQPSGLVAFNYFRLGIYKSAIYFISIFLFASAFVFLIIFFLCLMFLFIHYSSVTSYLDLVAWFLKLPGRIKPIQKLKNLSSWAN